MSKNAEPWYLHAGLWAIIVVLIVIMIQVSITGPEEIVRTREYNKLESRLRMKNLKQAEILYNEKHKKFTDNLDSLINFIRNDKALLKRMTEFDTVKIYSAKGDSTILKSRNPFVDLVSGTFNYDSLFFSPKSGKRFIVQVDTLVEADTVIDRRGQIVKVDKITTIGKRYMIKNPDSDDKIGDVTSDALLNTESWD